MNELGSVFLPEQYAREGDDCVLSDSVIALDFFLDRYEAGGLVFPGYLYLASLQDKFLPIWLYTRMENKELKCLSTAPIFKVDNFQTLENLQVLKIKIWEDETFFYWKDKLHASTYTSTGEIIIRPVRCILSLKDMVNVASLDESINITDCYPVKVYDQDSGRFLAVCWELEADESVFWYETICSDDDIRFQKINVRNTCSYPVSINELVILGDDFFRCCYNKDFGTYFKKLPFKATEADREKENLDLSFLAEKTTEKPAVKLSFIKTQQEEVQKGSNERKTKSKVIELHPKV